MTSTTQGEHRMLIDGKLVHAKSGKTFDNINPATEEVLGPVADAGHDDMDEAIAAARRAFDETTWATDKAFRQRCIASCRPPSKRRGAPAGGAGRRGGRSDRADLRTQLDAPLAEGRCGRPSTSTSSPGSGTCRRARRSARRSWRRVAKEAVGVVGAIVPWNYPEVTINKLGPSLAVGNTVILKAAPNTP